MYHPGLISALSNVVRLVSLGDLVSLGARPGRQINYIITKSRTCNVHTESVAANIAPIAVVEDKDIRVLKVEISITKGDRKEDA